PSVDEAVEGRQDAVTGECGRIEPADERLDARHAPLLRRDPMPPLDAAYDNKGHDPRRDRDSDRRMPGSPPHPAPSRTRAAGRSPALQNARVARFPGE